MDHNVSLSPIKQEGFFAVETQASDSQSVLSQVPPHNVPNFFLHLLRQKTLHAQQSGVWNNVTTDELLVLKFFRPTSIELLIVCLLNFKCCGDPLCPFWPSAVKSFCADHALETDFIPAKPRKLPKWMQDCVSTPSLPPPHRLER
ncbi:uncharacterized protein LOC117647847 [Thrips palmi]|uniref:Uncharacterized protein LOC117647847 n=1 Tax=Thrips palmi TaxID=161013 RepID=A0A6P8Z6A1_THRPL|nr:uncharacterized protein LOC117647847 [Thrips palmi]